MGNNLLDLGIKKLGFGYMRLPQKDGKFDIELLNQMADKYLDAGFSYFDTSPVYGMGQSESVFRRTVVERHPRESFQIATKLPMWTIDRPEEMQEKFDHSLKNLGVDYIDFYLLHGLSGVVSDRFSSSGIDKANKMGGLGVPQEVQGRGQGQAHRLQLPRQCRGAGRYPHRPPGGRVCAAANQLRRLGGRGDPVPEML